MSASWNFLKLIFWIDFHADETRVLSVCLIDKIVVILYGFGVKICGELYDIVMEGGWYSE